MSILVLLGLFMGGGGTDQCTINNFIKKYKPPGRRNSLQELNWSKMVSYWFLYLASFDARNKAHWNFAQNVFSVKLCSSVSYACVASDFWSTRFMIYLHKYIVLVLKHHPSVSCLKIHSRLQTLIFCNKYITVFCKFTPFSFSFFCFNFLEVLHPDYWCPIIQCQEDDHFRYTKKVLQMRKVVLVCWILSLKCGMHGSLYRTVFESNNLAAMISS